MPVKPRGILVAGNWKMNHGVQETELFFHDLKKEYLTFMELTDSALFEENRLQVCLIPPYLVLERSKALLRDAPFHVTIAAQNAHWETKGAYTGEISGPMLREIGVTTVLIGHSERRQYFGETDQTVKRRAESLLEQGFQVILCLGETREQYESKKTAEVLSRQVQDGTPEAHHPHLVIAYEPVWAIGTGITATPAQAEEAHTLLRQLFQKRWGKESAEKVSILYGGSVVPENVDALLTSSQVDGVLVGGASLKAKTFLSLIQAGARILR